MRRRSGSRRQLATVLFTDIVGSTERAAALGDRGWRQLLDRHHRLVRRILRRHDGREVDTAGDGFFATFTAPVDAITCAVEMMDALVGLDIVIRAGIHTGEVEPMGAKVGGIAVHLAARIMGAATGGQILASSTVRDLAGGGGFRFIDRGSHTLKGVDEAWHLFEIERPLAQPAVALAPAERAATTPSRGRLAVGGGVLAVALVAVALVVWRPWTPRDGTATGPNVIRAVGQDGALGTGFAVGRGPGALAVTDAAIWVGNVDGSTVSRVDRETGQSAVVGVGVPAELAIANDLLWVMDPFASTVTIIRPSDATVVGTIDVHGRAMAAGDGAVWLADDLSDAVHRIDPRTRSVAGTIELPPETGPAAIAVSSGSAWTANSLAGTVSRIDTANQRVVVEAIAIPATPTALAVAESGVWVVAQGADVLYRIDPSTNRIASQRPVCDGPTGVLASASWVWVACDSDHAVWRIGVNGGEPVVTELDGVPGALAADGDRLWVAVREP